MVTFEKIDDAIAGAIEDRFYRAAKLFIANVDPLSDDIFLDIAQQAYEYAWAEAMYGGINYVQCSRPGFGLQGLARH